MFDMSTDYKVLEVDQLLSVSKYLWTFDDLNDIKDLQGESWAQINGSLQSTTGVRRRAVKALGGAGFIELIKDATLSLANPLSHSFVTLSLWLSYEIQIPNVAQTFFATGDQENGDRGVRLYQEDGSKEELTFKITAANMWCSIRFSAFRRVWSHMVFSWGNSGGINELKVYLNGNEATPLAQQCHSVNTNDLPNQDVKIGLSKLPLASFDDIILWAKELSAAEVAQLFKFYIGKYPHLRFLAFIH